MKTPRQLRASQWYCCAALLIGFALGCAVVVTVHYVTGAVPTRVTETTLGWLSCRITSGDPATARVGRSGAPLVLFGRTEGLTIFDDRAKTGFALDVDASNGGYHMAMYQDVTPETFLLHPEQAEAKARWRGGMTTRQ